MKTRDALEVWHCEASTEKLQIGPSILRRWPVERPRRIQAPTGLKCYP